MDKNTYMQQRVDDQIQWLGNRAKWNQQQYRRIRLFVIILSVLIPFATGYVTDSLLWLKIAIGTAGVLIAIGEGMLALYKYQDNWVQYRVTSEALKREKLLYQTGVGNYRDAEQSFTIFVETIENILQQESKGWQQYAREEKA